MLIEPSDGRSCTKRVDVVYQCDGKRVCYAVFWCVDRAYALRRSEKERTE